MNSVKNSPATQKIQAARPTEQKEWWKRGALEYVAGCPKVDNEYISKRDWVNDESGYVLIRVNHEKGRVEVGFCSRINKISFVAYGKKPEDIYFQFAKHNLLSRHEHSAYLGMELQKACLALKHNLQYLQDDELDLPIPTP